MVFDAFDLAHLFTLHDPQYAAPVTALAELRRVPQPCSDAVALARVARWAVTRRLRHAATVLLQSMLLATRIPVTQGIALLLEGLQLCVQTLHARAIANGTRADCPGAVRLCPSQGQHLPCCMALARCAHLHVCGVCQIRPGKLR